MVGGGALGVVEGDPAVGVQAEVPAAFMDLVVVLVAQRQQVLEVCWSPVSDAGDDVVDLAVPEADLAAGEPAAAVHRPQRPALIDGGDPTTASLVQHDTLGAQHDGDDVASHAIRRTDSGGTWWPSAVSQPVWSWRPAARVSTSMSTDTSAGRRPPARGAVTAVTKASAQLVQRPALAVGCGPFRGDRGVR